MRLVLDTNVLIAAFVSRGVCHELLEHCEREHQLVSSPFILGEFEDKLLHKFKVPPEKARAARELIEAGTEVIEVQALDSSASRDPDDDWVLATAVAGRCRCIVTGDKDLLVLRQFRDIRILPPSDFWSFEAGHSSAGEL